MDQRFEFCGPLPLSLRPFHGRLLTFLSPPNFQIFRPSHSPLATKRVLVAVLQVLHSRFQFYTNFLFLNLKKLIRYGLLPNLRPKLNQLNTERTDLVPCRSEPKRNRTDRGCLGLHTIIQFYTNFLLFSFFHLRDTMKVIYVHLVYFTWLVYLIIIFKLKN